MYNFAFGWNCVISQITVFPTLQIKLVECQVFPTVLNKVKLSGIRWSKMVIFSSSQLWLNNILIFKITRYFLQLSEDFCLNFSYCLVVVNLCLAIERICYFMRLFPLLLFTFHTFHKQFHFATVVLSNNNIRKQVYMAFEHVFSTSK